MAGASDVWQEQFAATKGLADEVLASVQERDQKHANGTPEALRSTALARRKLGALNSKLDALAELLDAPECAGISEQETNRRRDLITALRNRREMMLLSLKRDRQQHDRGALLEGGGGNGGPARETEATADRDARGILQLQQETMSRQDDDIRDMEAQVESTKHLALTINEELSLQEGLLERFEEDVDVTHSKLRTAQKRVRNLLRNPGDCKCSLLAALLVVILVIVVLLGFKFVL